MPRKLAPDDTCQRRYLPTKLKAEVMLRQDGRCADCGTRLILGFFIFDHRPPLAMRDKEAGHCNEQKTPKDLKEIAKSKRVAEKHQAFLERQQEKQPGRRLPTRRQERLLRREMEVLPEARRVIDAWESSGNTTSRDAAIPIRKPPPLQTKPRRVSRDWNAGNDEQPASAHLKRRLPKRLAKSPDRRSGLRPTRGRTGERR